MRLFIFNICTRLSLPVICALMLAFSLSASVVPANDNVCSRLKCVFLPVLADDITNPVITRAAIVYRAPQQAPEADLLIQAELQNVGTKAVYDLSLFATVQVDDTVHTFTFTPPMPSLAPGCLTLARSDTFTAQFLGSKVDLLELHVATVSDTGTPEIVCMKTTKIVVTACPQEIPGRICFHATVTNTTNQTVNNIQIYSRKYHFEPVLTSNDSIPPRTTQTLLFWGDTLDVIYYGTPEITDLSTQASIAQ